MATSNGSYSEGWANWKEVYGSTVEFIPGQMVKRSGTKFVSNVVMTPIESAVEQAVNELRSINGY